MLDVLKLAEIVLNKVNHLENFTNRRVEIAFVVFLIQCYFKINVLLSILVSILPN